MAVPLQRTPAILPWLALLLASLAALGTVGWDVGSDAPGLLRGRVPAVEPRPGSAPPPVGRYRARLFFPEAGVRPFREEERELVQQPNLTAAVRAILGELAKGEPPVLPGGAAVRHAFQDGLGILYLDLPRDFQTVLTRPYPPAEPVVAALVNTLTASFPGVQRVQLLMEGQEIPILVGGLDLGRPLSPHFPEQLQGMPSAGPQ